MLCVVVPGGRSAAARADFIVGDHPASAMKKRAVVETAEAARRSDLTAAQGAKIIKLFEKVSKQLDRLGAKPSECVPCLAVRCCAAPGAACRRSPAAKLGLVVAGMEHGRGGFPRCVDRDI